LTEGRDNRVAVRIRPGPALSLDGQLAVHKTPPGRPEQQRDPRRSAYRSRRQSRRPAFRA